MPLTIYITKDFDQMSLVAAQLAELKIKELLAKSKNITLGLATGNSPTGMYKYLAKACNAERIDPRRVRTFNLDEYVGLPGGHAQERALHSKSYTYFMISEFFGLLQHKFAQTSLPGGLMIEQKELEAALAACSQDYQDRGLGLGRAIEIKPTATGVLRTIKDEILDEYAREIARAGGIDLQVIGVGGHGHVAFHESGIPFDCAPVMLVKLDNNTVANAVTDGNFLSVGQSPHYAVSMGATLVYQARTVLLLANGSRKNTPVAQSLLGDVTCELPISYGQKYAAEGGDLIYILDEAASLDLLAAQSQVSSKGYKIIDKRNEPYGKVEEVMFWRHPQTNLLG